MRSPRFRAARLLAVLLALAPALSLPAPGAPARASAHTPTAAGRAPAAPRQSHAAASGTYGRAPLSFEANRGQIDPSVRFRARGDGYDLFLTPGEAVFSLRGPSAVLRMSLVNAARSPRVVGEGEMAGKSHYYRGRDRRHWIEGVSSFARVRYEDAYPGIDLVYYGRGRELEYDFHVAPGADPSRIKLAFEGADRLALDSSGDLRLEAGGHVLTQSAPVAYQEVGGARRAVEASYVRRGENRVAFRVGAYDPALPLVIDPVVRLGYSTYFGGTFADQVRGVAVDSEGNAVVVGATSSKNFPASNDDPDPEGGSSEAFVTKFNPTGDTLIYSVFIGGTDFDVANAVALDRGGNAYVTGETSSADFPTTPGVVDEENENVDGCCKADAFVTKLDASGAVEYSTFIGGRQRDEGNAVAVDADGRAYVTGETHSRDFPLKNEFQDGHFMDAFPQDAFVTVLNSEATGYIYSSFFGGRSSEIGTGIALDSAGHAYITGQTDSDGTFPVKSPAGAGPFQERGAGGREAFVAKFNPFAAGDASLVYSTLVGGRGTDEGHAVAVDDLGLAHVTGVTGSVDFPLAAAPGAEVIDRENVVSEAFVLSVDREGSALNFSTFFGGENEEQGLAIGLDSARNIYVAGRTMSVREFPIERAFQPAPGGGNAFGDAFVAKLAPEGRDVIYASYLGGERLDIPSALAVDLRGNAYVVGFTFSGGFPVTPGAFQAAIAGGVDSGSDGFVTKVASNNPDTVGVYRPSATRFELRNANAAGPADIAQAFGQPGDLPIKGDWDGDGTDSIGLFRPSAGEFHLNNQNTDATADIVVSFGQKGDLPVAGDWDGDGDDEVGIFRDGFFELIFDTDGGPISGIRLPHGQAGDLPVAGDWDGDGADTVGVWRPSTAEFILSLSNEDPANDIVLVFGGVAGDLPVVGDWDGDGVDTVGVYGLPRNRGEDFAAGFFLNNSLTAQQNDFVFGFGQPGDRPLAGDWDGLP